MKRRSELANTPLVSTLIRVIVLLGLVSSLLHTGSARGSASVRDQASAERLPDCVHRPFFCNLISSIAVDYLGDPIGLPTAFQVSTGELASGRIAHFHVFALTYPGYRVPYANVTFERRPTKIRVRAPRGETNLSGHVYYDETVNNPVQCFAPSQQIPADRIAFIDFAYH